LFQVVRTAYPVGGVFLHVPLGRFDGDALRGRDRRLRLDGGGGLDGGGQEAGGRDGQGQAEQVFGHAGLRKGADGKRSKLV
jgi:hypothetical protein